MNVTKSILFSFSSSSLLFFNLYSTEGLGERLFSPEFQHIHYWIRRPRADNCRWCLYKIQRQRVLNKGAISKARPKRSRGGYVFCDIALCAEGECWSMYHSNNANH